MTGTVVGLFLRAAGIVGALGVLSACSTSGNQGELAGPSASGSANPVVTQEVRFLDQRVTREVCYNAYAMDAGMGKILRSAQRNEWYALGTMDSLQLRKWLAEGKMAIGQSMSENSEENPLAMAWMQGTDPLISDLTQEMITDVSAGQALDALDQIAAECSAIPGVLDPSADNPPALDELGSGLVTPETQEEWQAWVGRNVNLPQQARSANTQAAKALDSGRIEKAASMFNALSTELNAVAESPDQGQTSQSIQQASQLYQQAAEVLESGEYWGPFAARGLSNEAYRNLTIALGKVLGQPVS